MELQSLLAPLGTEDGVWPTGELRGTPNGLVFPLVRVGLGAAGVSVHGY